MSGRGARASWGPPCWAWVTSTGPGGPSCCPCGPRTRPPRCTLSRWVPASQPPKGAGSLPVWGPSAFGGPVCVPYILLRGGGRGPCFHVGVSGLRQKLCAFPSGVDSDCTPTPGAAALGGCPQRRKRLLRSQYPVTPSPSVIHQGPPGHQPAVQGEGRSLLPWGRSEPGGPGRGEVSVRAPGGRRACAGTGWLRGAGHGSSGPEREHVVRRS